MNDKKDVAVFRTIFAVLFSCCGRQSVNDAYTSADKFVAVLQSDFRIAKEEDEKAYRERSSEREREDREMKEKAGF